MMFPHDRKNVTINQITYHPPRASISLDNMISTINNASFSLDTIAPRIFKYASMLGIYQGYPPFPSPNFVFVLSLEEIETPSPQSPSPIEFLPQQNIQYVTPPLGTPQTPNLLTQFLNVPFLFPPPRIIFTLVMSTPQLPSLTLGILFWYLNPPHPETRPHIHICMDLINFYGSSHFVTS